MQCFAKCRLSKSLAVAPFKIARLPLAMGYALTLLVNPAQAADEPVELQSISITGELDSPVGEDTGYAAKNSRSATKTNTPLNETPRSVVVVTEQQMRDRNVSSIGDALRYSPGIQGNYFGEDNKQDWFIVRGFKQANNGIFQDGVRVYSSGFYSWQVDPYALERVEVLKGAASVLYGQSTPGGVINLQSKRPTREPSGEVGAQYGSYDRKQLNLDVGGALDDSGNVLYRVVALTRDTGTQVDDVDAKRQLIAPSLTLNLNDATSLTLLASFQKDDSDPQLQFLPAAGALYDAGFGYIDDDTAFGNPAYETFQRSQYTLGYELNHRINDNWDFQQNMRYGHMDLEVRQMYFAGASPFDPSGRTPLRGLTYHDGTANNLSLDNRLVNYAVGENVESTFLVGVDYQRLNIKDEGYATDPLIVDAFNPYNPSYGAVALINRQTFAPFTDADLQDKRTRADQVGLYVQEQLKLNDKWVFILGGRYDKARTDLDNRTTGVSQDVRDEEFTWSAGVAYLFENGLTPYASYSEFFLPVTALNTTTQQPFQPETGDQKEVGLKYQPPGFDGYVNIAAFELTQQNVRKTAPGGIQTQLGEVTARGIELEAVADVTEQFSVTGSMTFLDPEITKSPVAGERGSAPSQVAERLASLWGTYRFGGALDGFALGAGVRYTGETYGDNTETLKVPSYTLYDAMASYRFDQVTVQLNANNLTDKQYVATCDFNCFYGNRRNVTASVSYAW